MGARNAARAARYVAPEWGWANTDCAGGSKTREVGKVAYQTRTLAKTAAKDMGRRGQGKLGPYFCAACGWWHIGHSSI